MRFEKSEYHVTEEEKTVDITLLTHRPPSRSFSVSLRSRHNSSQSESYAVCIILFSISAHTCLYTLWYAYSFMCFATAVNRYVVHCSKTTFLVLY